MGAMTRRWLTVAVASVAALALGAGTGHAAETEPTGPVQPNILTAAAYSLADPTIAPPGANDWNCKPSARHPNPVLLSNGTTANAYENWANLSWKLANAGYCVFAGNFGGAPGAFLQTVGPVADTTKALAAFGDKILRATGAAKLDVVGHSQGGMNVRYWIKYLGGAGKISRLVGLSPSNHGTDLFGLLSTLEMIPGVPAALGTVCQACNEQAVGSGLPHRPQRRWRDRRQRPVHRHPDPVRRRRHALHQCFPGTEAEREEHPAAERLRARLHRPPRHHLRPRRRGARPQRARSRPRQDAALRACAAGDQLSFAT